MTREEMVELAVRRAFPRATIQNFRGALHADGPSPTGLEWIRRAFQDIFYEQLVREEMLDKAVRTVISNVTDNPHEGLRTWAEQGLMLPHLVAINRAFWRLALKGSK